METIQPLDDVAPKKTRSIGRILLGLLFLLPSLFFCISQLLLPTINTFGMSFQKINLAGSEKVYVGLDNYAHLFADQNFWRATDFTLITLLVRLFVVALVPLLLAWWAGQFERPVRVGLRILLTLPVVFFIPVVIAVAWLMFLSPARGLFPFWRSWVANAASARSTVLYIDALYLFGLASGLGLMAYLPVWRRSADAPQPTLREVLKPMLVIFALGILGISALTLSTFTLNFALTNGGPGGSTTTLGIFLYQSAFHNFNMGLAASVASLMLLVALALGILGGFLVILTRLRLDIVDTKPTVEKVKPRIAPERSRDVAGISLALLVLLTLAICLCSALPFGALIPQALGPNGLGRLLEQVSAGRVFINTSVPPLVAATVQVLIAYLAALSIGALRPLGKRSEWLLLLFSPWLFITVLPLSLVYFAAARKADLLDTLQGSLSPILFSIPALFILTIFFTGRTSSQLRHETTKGASDAAPNFFQHFIKPSLPLTVVLWLMLVIFNGQDVVWPLLVSVSPERYTLNVTLLRLAETLGGANNMLAAAIIFLILPVCVFFFISLALLQVFYLDRLTLYAENSSTEKATQDSGGK